MRRYFDDYVLPTPKCGFGVFARRCVSFAEMHDALSGWLVPVNESDFAGLELSNHPSLFTWKNKRFVLVGALSLLNHHCDASVGYESPRVVPATMTDIPAFVKLLGDCLLLQMFDSTDDSNHPGWLANEEILIHYGNRAFKECKCSGCMVESKDDYRDDDDDNDTAKNTKICKYMRLHNSPAYPKFELNIDNECTATNFLS
jgi:hypothetical protein